MRVTATKTGVTVSLTTEEAIYLESVFAQLTGSASRNTGGLYDRIADALEERHLDTTISHALEQRGLNNIDLMEGQRR